MPASLRVLTPEILRQSRTSPEGFGFNGLGAAVFHRTYVRRLPDGTLAEPFAEDNRADLTAVLARVVEGTYRIQREHQPASRWDEDKARRSAAEMFHHMRRMYFLPPGRGLWSMGSDFVHERGTFEALQNCFAGDELLYVRNRGSVMFAEVVDETVEVLTDKGWRTAVVKDFGVQPLQAITFAPGRGRRTNHRETVKATPNHRWLLADGRETTDLRVGDVVRGNVADERVDESSYDEGFRHGVIFGDGTAGYEYVDGSRSYFARLCGDKAQYADKFPHLTYPESAAGDPVVTVRSVHNLKNLPQGETDHSYLRGFVAGWLATDGTSVDETGGIIGSQNPYAYDWLREHAPLAGFVVVGVNTDTRDTNYGKRSAPLWKVTLRSGTDWVVKNIEPLDEDRVFCAVVPDGASFTLFGGIYTGNCAFMSTEYLPGEGGDAWRWMAEMLMLGVGVGFDTKGAGLLTLRPPMADVVEVYEVSDTRQGWGFAFERLWDSYQVPGRPTVRFDFSRVRPKGTPILGFGGVASGPEPLAEALELGRLVLDRAVGRPLTSRTIVDFGNLIGQCVVAGNVRRSAEIALGVPGDREFLDLKNPAAFGGWEGLAKERPWSWLSNNSVLVDSRSRHEPDYDDVASRIYENGEPGIVWLDAARRYGRYGEELPDWDVRGVNPCAEQQLGHREMCTLVETFPSRIPDLPTYLRTLKYAYLYAKTVTVANAMVSDDISRAVMSRNYRIGLSTSGIVQAIGLRGEETMVRWWREGYDAIQAYDETYSRWLGVPRSVRTTSVKPSGTVSLVAGVTPGVHYPVSRYYVRRFDVPANSEILPLLVANGYEVEPSVTNPGTSYKVLFPVDSGPGTRAVTDVPLREQVRLAALAQRHHADNMVSFTGTFSRETTAVADVADALRQARGSLKAVSFLPAEHGYEQPPYEPVDRERVEAMLARMRPVDFDLLGHEDENAYCDNDTCELPEVAP